MSRPYPRPIKWEPLEVKPRHHYFGNSPRNYSVQMRLINLGLRAVDLKLVCFTLNWTTHPIMFCWAPPPEFHNSGKGRYWAFLISSWVMLIPLVPGPHFEKQGSRGLASPVSHHMLQIPTFTSWLLSRVQSLCWEEPLEEDIAALSIILAWRIFWTEEPGRLWSTES